MVSGKMGDGNLPTPPDTSLMELGLPGGTSGKEATVIAGDCKRSEFSPWVRKIPWRRAWQLTLVFLPGESHGQRNLEDYSH